MAAGPFRFLEKNPAESVSSALDFFYCALAFDR